MNHELQYAVYSMIQNYWDECMYCGYLDVEEGGETAFVETSLADPDFEAEYGPFSPCAKGHIAVRPKKV